MRDSFHRLLSQRCAEDDVRRSLAAPDGHDSELWSAIAELGVTGLLIDPEFGGLGAGPVELEMLMEELGAAIGPATFLSSSVMAASLIGLSSDSDAKARLFPPLASGQSIATAAMTGDKGLWTAEDVTVTASGSGQAQTLSGTASYVLSAAVSDILLVVARTGAGLQVYEAPIDGAGVTITPLKSWDPTLRMSRIAFEGVAARPLEGANAAVINRVLDLARVALAGEQAGAARRIFDITVEYLRTRVQFGRPIGGFQALKHMAADLLLEVESATSAARAAAQALANDASDRRQLVSLAAFACADAFSQVAATSIQMHGGIAFTWEHVAHLYLRRARADAQLLGPSSRYREDYVSELEKIS